MKIAVISNLYLPYNRGGAEIVAAKAVKNFVGSGNITDVLTIGPFGGVESFFLEESKGGLGENIFRFFPLNFFSYININKYRKFYFIPIRAIWHIWDIINPHTYFIVKDFLETTKPEVVYTHNLKGLGLMSARAISSYIKTNKNTSWVHHLHDVQFIVPSGLLKASPEGIIDLHIINIIYAPYQYLCKFIVGSPTMVVSPTDWLIKIHTQKAFFPFSDFEIIKKPTPDKSSVNILKRKEKIAQKEANFVFAGQLEQHKGIELLIDAWKLWIDQMSDDAATKEDIEGGLLALPTLHIAGAGSYEKYVSEEARKDKTIKFYGKLPQEEVLNLMDGSIAVVVPSIINENAPNVIKEAHSMGARVIAARVGGIPEIIFPDDILFEPNVINDLIEAINKCYLEAIDL